MEYKVSQILQKVNFQKISKDIYKCVNSELTQLCKAKGRVLNYVWTKSYSHLCSVPYLPGCRGNTGRQGKDRTDHSKYEL